MITNEQKKELDRRNAKIYKRFCNLSERQPLAYPHTIYTELAKEFELSPQMIGLIVRTAQKIQQQ